MTYSNKEEKERKRRRGKEGEEKGGIDAFITILSRRNYYECTHMQELAECTLTRINDKEGTNKLVIYKAPSDVTLTHLACSSPKIGRTFGRGRS